MAKRTGRAIVSGKARTPGSKHTGKAMAHTVGYGPRSSNKHSGKAMARTRPMQKSAEPREITEAKRRRNFSGIPKTK